MLLLFHAWNSCEGFEDRQVSLLLQKGANTRDWSHLCLFGDFQDSGVLVCHCYCKSRRQCCGMAPSMGMPALQQIGNKTWAKVSVREPCALTLSVGTFGQLLCLPAGATWGVIFMWISECFPEVVFLHPTLLQTGLFRWWGGKAIRSLEVGKLSLTKDVWAGSVTTQHKQQQHHGFISTSGISPQNSWIYDC